MCPFYRFPYRAASLCQKPALNRTSRHICHDQTINTRDVLYKTAYHCVSPIKSYRTPRQTTANFLHNAVMT